MPNTMLNAATVQYLPPLRISQYNYHTTLIPYKQRQVYRRQEGRDGGRTSPKPSGSVPLIIYGEGRGQNIPQMDIICWPPSRHSVMYKTLINGYETERDAI